MRHKISIYSALVLLLGLAACTQDEQPTGGAEGTPMTFTATGLDFNEAHTRATVDDTWEAESQVAIQIDSEVKSYTVSETSGSAATLTSTDPFYWTTTEPKEVEAWYPYNPEKPTAVVVQADQSSTGFAASDFLEAGPQQVSVGATSLKFTHRTARIAVTLSAGTGIASVEDAEVRFTGLDTEKNPATIIPHESTGNVYEALVAPQTIGTTMPFITVELNGMTYSYTPTAAKELKAGTRYNYNLKVNAAGLELEGCTITGWAPQDEVSADAGFGHANGGETYIVGTADELKAWRDYVNDRHYSTNCILINDIVLPKEDNWTPVCPDVTDDSRPIPYTGIFEGNNHTITGVTVAATTMLSGFVGSLGAGGEVKNLKLENVNIGGQGITGSVVAYTTDGIISNCHATGEINDNNGQMTGGITGCLMGGSITACSSNVTVSGYQKSGGIAGTIVTGEISNCQSKGTVIGTSYIGGVVGAVEMGEISQCYSTGDVQGTSYAGGVAGMNGSNGIITACYYSAGTITGGTNVGGVIGQNMGSVTACYSTGRTTGQAPVGGVIGQNTATTTVTACYWAGNQAAGIGDNQGTGEATKVENETTWQTATTAMNAALEALSSDWKYTQAAGSENNPPTLQKKTAAE